MNKLLTYTPELFPELDPEAEDEVRGPRRPRALPPSSRAPASFRGKPKASIPRLRPMPLPRLVPVVSPLWHLPRDTGWPDDNRRTDQAGSQGSGEPANTQYGEPPSEYVRWVQDSLNRALGLQLPIDGIMNRETRSAVRSFQERRGLPINGLVGPETEAALKAASSSALAPTQDAGPNPAAEWETPSSASSNCTSCDGRTSMDYDLGFEAEPFAGARTFNEYEAEDTEALEEWQGEMAQESPQRVRWIQESLNKILGLRLKVDGIMGPQTRSAIRSFQTTRGLGADGIVGPKTQAAMNAALGGVQVPPQANPPYTTPALLTPPAGQGTQRTVYGWSQYKQRVEDLPADQKAILNGIGDAIIASYSPGNRQVLTVDVHGHADWDTPRNPWREQQMSDERARIVTEWLLNYVGSTVADRIVWLHRGMGARQLKTSPTSEENRQRNRRVELSLSMARAPVACRLEATGRIDAPASTRRVPNSSISRGMFSSVRAPFPRSPVPRVRFAQLSPERGSDSEFEAPTQGDAGILQKAFRDSRKTVALARNALSSLLNGFAGEQQDPPRSLNAVQMRVLISVGRWLRASTEKTPAARRRAAEIVRRAITLMDDNLAVKTTGGQSPPLKRIYNVKDLALSYVGKPDLGIDCGDSFFTIKGPNCRRDVITHEFFHLFGVKHGGQPIGKGTDQHLITTPDQALDSADNLAQLVSEIMNGRTNACINSGD